MTSKRKGSRIFGLFLALSLIVMAVSSSAAQAEDQGDFTANGTSLTASETFLATGEGEGILLTPSIVFNILCSSTHVEGIALGGTKAANGVAHWTAEFKGCKSIDNKGNENQTCVVKDVVAKGLALVVLVAGFTSEKFVLIEPEVGKPFTTIQIGNAAGKECNLEPSYELTGTILAKATESAGTSGKELLLVEATETQKKAGKDAMLFGAHPIIMDGSILAHYTGALKAAAVGVKIL